MYVYAPNTIVVWKVHCDWLAWQTKAKRATATIFLAIQLIKLLVAKPQFMLCFLFCHRYVFSTRWLFTWTKNCKDSSWRYGMDGRETYLNDIDMIDIVTSITKQHPKKHDGFSHRRKRPHCSTRVPVSFRGVCICHNCSTSEFFIGFLKCSFFVASICLIKFFWQPTDYFLVAFTVIALSLV